MNKYIQCFRVGLLATVLFCSFGCETQTASPQQLNLDLDPDDIRTILVDPSTSEYTLSLDATSDGPPIKVFVYLSEDDEAVTRAIMLGQTTEKIMISESDTDQISLSVKIPAGKEASIRLQTASPEKANATLTIQKM